MAIIDASGYPNIGAAFAACGSSDQLYCPISGSPYTAPAGGMVITQPFKAFCDPGVRINTASGAVNDTVFDIQPPAGATLQRVIIDGFKFGNVIAASSVVSGNHAIKCVLDGTTNTIMEWLEIRNCEAVGFGDSSYRFKGATGSNCVFIFPRLFNVISDGSYSHGFLFESGGGTMMTNCLMETCYALNSQDQGARLDASIAVLLNCYWESNCRANTLSATTSGQLRLRSGDFVVIGNTFENFTTASQLVAKRGLVAENSPSLTCWNNTFINNAESSDASQRCYYLTYGGGGAHKAIIGPSRVSNTKTWVEVDSADRDVDIYEPFNQAGTKPVSILPATMHMRSWT